MKFVEQLTQKLEELNLSDERKNDLISKYMLADQTLEREMNEYFHLRKSPAKKKAKASNKKALISKRQNPKAQYVDRQGSYRGSNACIIDHRARPTTDVHSNSDRELDKEYFKNS